MSSLFQIVFKGELLDGFDMIAVKASAHKRLKAAPEQIDRIFSGRRAVLKKGLTEEAAQRYLAELQRIGMRVSVESEAAAAPQVKATQTAGVAAGQSTTAGSSPQRVTSRDIPDFDPLKTQLAFPPADDIPPPPPERWNQPTIAISQRHLNSLQPTVAVPPSNSVSSDPTLIVRRSETSPATSPDVAQSGRGYEAAEPTMIVPPRSHAGSSDPTLIVPPRRSAASEPTMIVPPRHSAASEPTLIVPPRGAASSDPTMIVPPRSAGGAAPVIVRADQKVVRRDALTPEAEAGFDAEKTLVATDEAIADYLSPAADEPRPNAAPPAPAQTNSGEEVACPTCGERQPPRVHCRRCGNVIAPMPTGTFTAPSLTRPPAPPPEPKPAPVSEETVIYDPEEALNQEEGAERRGLLATPSWVLIVLLIAVLMIGATWLFI